LERNGLEIIIVLLATPFAASKIGGAKSVLYYISLDKRNKSWKLQSTGLMINIVN